MKRSVLSFFFLSVVLGQSASFPSPMREKKEQNEQHWQMLSSVRDELKTLLKGKEGRQRKVREKEEELIAASFARAIAFSCLSSCYRLLESVNLFITVLELSSEGSY